MKSVEKLVRQYLPKVNIMQLATSVNDQPWVCTLHYYNDDDLNFYWLSTPERRHSREIKQNPKVSVAIKFHENTAEEDYIIGISVEGVAELLGHKVDAVIAGGYLNKMGVSQKFFDSVLSGHNPHKFYRLKPTNIVMFNTKDFPDNPRQEFKVGA